MADPFVWFDLKAVDGAGAANFYGELLGWEIAEGDPAMIGNGQPWGGVSRGDGSTSGWVPYVQVDDVAEATARAKALGAKVVAANVPGPAGVATTIEDPAGALIALWQQR